MATAYDQGPKSAASGYKSGDVIGGKYRLYALLGEGGMGSVWRAKNTSLAADVAVKVIRSGATSDGADRLLREARASAKILDPAIVRVFDFGKSEKGDPFIVMELLDGEDLSAAILSRGRLSPKRAVRVLLPVIRALAVAHGQKVIHRDLKPENVFLAKAPCGLQPKLLDFGIAKVDQSASLRLTQTGALVGSPLYMSPEQARGEQVDYRADIWAVCVLLYEALTGKPPFHGENYNAVLYAVLSEQPRSLLETGLIDETLWSILQRGLSKEPAYRYSSMQELGSSLAKWLVDQGVHEDITGASLKGQWFQNATQVDQLATVFPPAEQPQIREQAEAVTTLPAEPRAPAKPPTASTSKRVLAVVAVSLAAGAAIGWTLFSSPESESAAGEATGTGTHRDIGTKSSAALPQNTGAAEPAKQGTAEKQVAADSRRDPTADSKPPEPQESSDRPSQTQDVDASTKKADPMTVKRWRTHQAAARAKKLKNPFEQ